MGLIAVFDFDGTLIKKDSMFLFFKRYFNFSLKNTGKLLVLFKEAAWFIMKKYNQKQFKEKFINIIISSSKIRDIDKISGDFSDFLIKNIFKEAIKEKERLAKTGYETVLLSASPDFYLKEIKKKLDFNELICTETSIIGNKIVITGENCYGKTKIKKLQEIYPEVGVDWKNSYCFADHLSDEHLLKLFGNPVVVNDLRLKRKNPHFKYVVWK